jgi:hypothetical protein
MNQPLLHWKSIKYFIFEYVSVALGIQHAMRIRHIVVCIFPEYLIKGKIKKVTEHKMCDFIFSTNFVWNISNSTKNWERYDKIIYWSSRKVTIILVKF